MKPRRWRRLTRAEERHAAPRMTGSRAPLEPFLTEAPPRLLALREQRLGEMVAIEEWAREIVGGWQATRAWVLETRSIPDREGPRLELDVVFFVDDSPVRAEIVHDNDALHWAMSDRAHHHWFHSLFRGTGEGVTVLHGQDPTEYVLFGDLRTYVHVDFKATLEAALTEEDEAERRRYLMDCIDIVLETEDAELAVQAIRTHADLGTGSDRTAWYTAMRTALQRGEGIEEPLARMLPIIGASGLWLWAAY